MTPGDRLFNVVENDTVSTVLSNVIRLSLKVGIPFLFQQKPIAVGFGTPIAIMLPFKTAEEEVTVFTVSVVSKDFPVMVNCKVVELVPAALDAVMVYVLIALPLRGVPLKIPVKLSNVKPAGNIGVIEYPVRTILRIS